MGKPLKAYIVQGNTEDALLRLSPAIENAPYMFGKGYSNPLLIGASQSNSASSSNSTSQSSSQSRSRGSSKTLEQYK